MRFETPKALGFAVIEKRLNQKLKRMKAQLAALPSPSPSLLEKIFFFSILVTLGFFHLGSSREFQADGGAAGCVAIPEEEEEGSIHWTW